MIDNLLAFCINGLYYISNLLFGWIQLPPFPPELTDSINAFLDLIFNNLSLLGLFIRPSTFFITIPLLIALFNFEILYKVTMWLINKIPFINVD